MKVTMVIKIMGILLFQQSMILTLILINKHIKKLTLAEKGQIKILLKLIWEVSKLTNIHQHSKVQALILLTDQTLTHF